MKRRTVLRGAAVGAALATTGLMAGTASANSPHASVCVTEQRTNRLLTFRRDTEWTEENVVWSWNPGVGGWYNLSDVRFRRATGFGRVALAAASGGNAGIIRLTGNREHDLDDLLWYGEPGGNPHAIERVPGSGVVVTASSHGHLDVYAPSRPSHPDTLRHVQTVELPGAHGVLWSPSLRVLWGIGDEVLKAYEVTGNGRDSRLVETGAQVTFPGLGHDLQPDYGHKGRLLITDTYAAYEVDTRSLTATVILEGRLIKSYVRDKWGEAMWLQAEDLPPRRWSSDVVHFDTEDKLHPEGQIYKARLLNPEFD
ncbi:hypothetical protein LX16_2009 [Stackebrandtia albiflava]|uniref:Uncharacterized protein n=1 Tax=Stackebrandtia albiflava TaxID=406432 RepID=A0A562VEH2_9ACTN|nr:DUF6528 family protein [Stackebrandtia albiflava]TWJ16282.1 hypothetical protein LX16_2009 [Stackebrandtia albiflava]